MVADGTTPLHTAAFSNNAVVAEALLNNGADISILDYEGDSALSQSLHSSADDVTLLLLSREASYTAWDSMGYSVLHEAALWGGCRTLGILRAAKMHNVDPDAHNRQGRTALQLVYARAPKPEGFVDKFQELLIDIRTRNTELQNAKTRNQTVEPGCWIHRFCKRLRLIQITPKVLLQHHFQSRYRQNTSSNFSISFVDILLLSPLLALALGLLGLCLTYHALGLNRVMKIAVVAWRILSPGDWLEH